MVLLCDTEIKAWESNLRTPPLLGLAYGINALSSFESPSTKREEDLKGLY